MSCTVAAVEHLGSETPVHVDVGDGNLVNLEDHGFHLGADRRSIVRLAVDTDDALQSDEDEMATAPMHRCANAVMAVAAQ